MEARLLPEFRFEGNRRLLFNPVRKKCYKNLPEERVRLSEVNRLLQEGHSKALIQTENAVAHQANDRLRSDIVVYDRNGKPQILVECKAPSVELNEAVLSQSFRYNQSFLGLSRLFSNELKYKLTRRYYGDATLPKNQKAGSDVTYLFRKRR